MLLNTKYNFAYKFYYYCKNNKSEWYLGKVNAPSFQNIKRCFISTPDNSQWTLVSSMRFLYHTQTHHIR